LRRLLARLAGLALVAVSAKAAATPQKVVFVGYNLENYSLTERRGDSGRREVAPKKEASIAAIVRVIAQINPDILGVCEMGPPGAFEDFRHRLEIAGLRFTDSEFVNGPDPDRHLALLSRYPIIARHSRPDISFELHGAMEKVRRGILDVTIGVNNNYDLRLVGAHLKSKLSAPEGEALLRRNEAHLLRQHVESILKVNPATNLLVYGDFNDTKNEPAIQEIIGPNGGPEHLSDLPLQDENGDRWTHYWKFADLYSRIDYILVNQGLFPEINPSGSRIFRSANWNEASDHRPVIATIRAKETKAKKRSEASPSASPEGDASSEKAL
jgi:endonuclease/exonuclease/phosphatase family metal-dependent hydrolase